MNKYKLKPFIQLSGIGAASGLLYEKEKLLLVSDEGDVLYEYHIENQTLSKISLRSDGQLLESKPKAEKFDFESITKLGEEMLIFGSGSAVNRNLLVKLNKENQVEEIDLTDFYNQLKVSAHLSDEDFNIEGAIAQQNLLLLFNRGNGPNAQNGIFKVENWQEFNNLQIEFISVPLPMIENVPFGFTDAIQLDDEIYFLASAEAGGSTYHDGEVLGSLLGVIDTNTFELKFTQLISQEHKFEGIALYEQTESELSFLLCEDADDGGDETEIFLLVVSL